MLHTIPYNLWSWALVVFAISETVYGIVGNPRGYWERIGLKRLKYLFIPYCIVFACAAMYKQVTTIYAWVSFPNTEINVTLDALGFQVKDGSPCEYKPCEWQTLPAVSYTESVKIVGQICDYIFLLCALVVPLAKTILLICKRRTKLETVMLEVSLHHHCSTQKKKIAHSITFAPSRGRSGSLLERTLANSSHAQVGVFGLLVAVTATCCALVAFFAISEPFAKPRF